MHPLKTPARVVEGKEAVVVAEQALWVEMPAATQRGLASVVKAVEELLLAEAARFE